MKSTFTSLLSFILCFLLFTDKTCAQALKSVASTVAAPLNQPGPEKSLQFIQNKNQWDKAVHYMAQLPGGRLFLRAQGLTYAFYNEAQLDHHHTPSEKAKTSASPNKIKAHAYSVNFLGASTTGAAVTGQLPTPGVRNYFVGNDPKRWAAGVKAYEEVTYQALYPGIAMHLFEKDAHLKYEFLVAPHTNPNVIRMQYQGADKLFIQNQDLHIKTSVTEVIEKKPYAYQMQQGRPVEVPCTFKLDGDVVTFAFPQGYDASQPLVIDPVLIFSTFSGSRADNWGFTATYDQQGNMYSGGIVAYIGFPATTGAYDISWNNNNDPMQSSASWDVGILKYNPSASGASSLVYATYLGGNLTDVPNSLVVNNKNELLILGVTSSDNFPTSTGAHSRRFSGGSDPIEPLSGIVFSQGTDLFISRLNADGSALLASTYLGGTANDGILAGALDGHPLNRNYGDQFRGDIFTDSTDQVYIVSSTRSSNFPIRNGFQTRYGGGNNDGVIAKLTPALALQWSSFIGGGGADAVYSIQLDSRYNILVAGGTTSDNLPGARGAFRDSYQGGIADGFVAKINNNGTALQRLSYIGTPAYDQNYFVQLDDTDNVYLLGQTLGSYPISAGVYAVPNGKQFIQKLNNDLTSSVFSTTFGAPTNNNNINISPTAFLVDNCARLYICGWGGGPNSAEGGQSFPNGSTIGLPTTSDAQQRTTDGRDFYLMQLTRDATALEYATFIGNASPNGEHVDGGTSRFDKRGFVYQAVCGGCRGTSAFPTTPTAWSQNNNSSNCNNAAFKFNFNFAVADAGPDRDVCVTEAPFQLTASPAGGTWSGQGVSPTGLFTPSPNNIGSFTLTYTVANGTCVNTDTKVIRVSSMPVVVPGPNEQICSGSYPVMLSGFSPAGGTWTGNGVSPDGLFTPTDALVGTHVLTYTVTNGGCSVVQTKTIVVEPSLKFSQGPELTLCHDAGPFAITDVNPPGGTWTGNGVSPDGVFTPSPTMTGRQQLTYFITVGACSGVSTKYITINPLPEVKAAPEPTDCSTETSIQGFAPFTANFTNTTTGATGYVWEFGDGSTSQEVAPSHQYNTPGTYNVDLTVSFGNNCQLKKRITTVIVEKERLIPNIFTPNQDGYNDTFVPRVTCLPTDLKIFNRWGQQVYEGKNYQNTWAGEGLTDGIYYYQLTSSKGEIWKGWVEITR